MELIINWVVSALAILVTAYFLPGVAVSGFLTALAVAVVLGILNLFIKPILIVLTLPINILTLGLFTLVINAFLIWLIPFIVPGFRLSGFLSAFLFALILAIVMWVLHIVFRS